MYKTIDIYITDDQITLTSEYYRTTRSRINASWLAADDIIAIAQSYAIEMQAYDESYHDLLDCDDCCDYDRMIDYDVCDIIVRPVQSDGCLHLQAVIC